MVHTAAFLAVDEINGETTIYSLPISLKPAYSIHSCKMTVPEFKLWVAKGYYPLQLKADACSIRERVTVSNFGLRLAGFDKMFSLN